MSPERLELVKRTGYVGCLSAYGRVNPGPVDKFNVLRGGIDSNFNEMPFRYRCEDLK
jgi:hypothetical protein